MYDIEKFKRMLKEDLPYKEKIFECSHYGPISEIIFDETIIKGKKLVMKICKRCGEVHFYDSSTILE